MRARALVLAPLALAIALMTGCHTVNEPGKTDKIEQFIALMIPLGLIEVARTGVAAISRGPEGMKI